MNRFFDIKALDVNEEIESPLVTSGARAEKYTAIHCKKIESIKLLVKELPPPGVEYKLWTINSFNAFTFIQYLFKELGTIDELIVTTFTINMRIIDSLALMLDRNRITRAMIFLNSGFVKRSPLINDHLTAMINSRSSKISVVYAWNHSKISLINIGEHYFIVDGSGNWGENAQFEQYSFYDSRECYDFWKNEINYAAIR